MDGHADEKIDGLAWDGMVWDEISWVGWADEWIPDSQDILCLHKSSCCFP